MKRSMLFFGLMMMMVLPYNGNCTTHMFIEYKVQFCVDDSGVKGFYVNWALDQVYASFIKGKFDADKNGFFEKPEQAAIFSSAFSAFKTNGYFCCITLDEKKLPAPGPQQFKARLEKSSGLVFYSFFIPLIVPCGKNTREIEAYFFDPVVDVTFTTSEKDVTVQNRSTLVEATPGLKIAGHVGRPTLTLKGRP